MASIEATPADMGVHDERLLVEQATHGDEAAFEALYRQHGPRAWRLALAVAGNPHDAADALSESVAKVFTALRQGRVAPGTPFGPYLLVATRNAAIDLHRRTHRERPTGDGAVLDLHRSGDPAESMEADEDADIMAEAFAQLPERWRSVLWLTEVEGLKPRHAAPIVGLSANATSQLAVRARKGLREQYLRSDLGRSADRNCGRSVRRLGAYVSGTLSTAEIDRLERHLKLCDACRDRYDRLVSIGSRLPLLALPLPLLVDDQVHRAWVGAVAVAATGTGLSRTAERVLAATSAAAAVVSVMGAALAGLPKTNRGDLAVAPVAPIVTELAAPRLSDLDLSIDLDPNRLPDVDTGGNGGAGAGGVVASSDPDAEAVPASDVGSGSGASDPGGSGTGGTSDAPTAPREPTPPSDGGDDPDGEAAPPPEEPETESEPVLSVGTDVGGTEVGVEIGEDGIGATVGGLEIGGGAESGDDVVDVGGALEPLDPVADTVNDTVDGLTGGLGL